MRKTLVYIVLITWLLAFLDWQSVHLTRWVYRDKLDWMHGHEKAYALVTRSAGVILCSPCMALKPLMYYSLMNVEACQEERDSITHAPGPTWRGFYTLQDRRYSWTFIPWLAWFGYWIPISLLWWEVWKNVPKIFVHR